jgi:hypothetical protein
MNREKEISEMLHNFMSLIIKALMYNNEMRTSKSIRMFKMLSVKLRFTENDDQINGTKQGERNMYKKLV